MDYGYLDNFSYRCEHYPKEKSELEKILTHIDLCNQGDSYACLRPGLYSGGNWWTIYACDYTPEYGAKIGYGNKYPKELTFLEALLVYITYEKRELSHFMEREIREKKKFILDHFSPEELEEHADLLRRSKRKEVKDQILKEKEALKKKFAEFDEEFRKLDEKLKELDK